MILVNLLGFESRSEIWLRFDGYTPYYYRKVLEGLHSENGRKKLIISYAQKKTTDQPKPLSRRYLAKNRASLSRQNVRFIENARETYEAGLSASNHIKPILYHYSWHSFLAFLMYTFMRFDGRAGGHGITVSKMEPHEINLEFHPFKKKGFFQRVLDVLTILEYPLAFAKWIPILEDRSITFVENSPSPFAGTERVNLKDIAAFDAKAYVLKVLEKFELPAHVMEEPIWMNDCIRSFIMHFAASTISRYKPQVWSKILEGEKEYESTILTKVRQGYENYGYFITQIHNRFLKS